MYQCRPSELLGNMDEYTAFCFDEACAYIISRIDDGEEPVFKKQYKSFKELYSKFS